MSNDIEQELARIRDEFIQRHDRICYVFSRAIQQAGWLPIDPPPKPTFAEAMAIVDGHYKAEYGSGLLEDLECLRKETSELRMKIGDDTYHQDGSISDALEDIAKELDCIGSISVNEVEGFGDGCAYQLRNAEFEGGCSFDGDDLPGVEDIVEQLHLLLPEEDTPEESEVA